MCRTIHLAQLIWFWFGTATLFTFKRPFSLNAIANKLLTSSLAELGESIPGGAERHRPPCTFTGYPVNRLLVPYQWSGILPDTPMSELQPNSDFPQSGQTETQKVRQWQWRTARQTPEPTKWTIRGVEPETHLINQKVANRTGKTQVQFIKDHLGEAATNVLKKGDQPSARAEYLVTDLFHLVNILLRYHIRGGILFYIF